MTDPAALRSVASVATTPASVVLTAARIVDVGAGTSALGAIWVRDGVLAAMNKHNGNA